MRAGGTEILGPSRVKQVLVGDVQAGLMVWEGGRRPWVGFPVCSVLGRCPSLCSPFSLWYPVVPFSPQCRAQTLGASTQVSHTGFLSISTVVVSPDLLFLLCLLSG